MDDSKSNPENNENKRNEIFHDAPDEFPFYESPSSSSSIQQTHHSFQQSPVFHTGPRLRRRSFSHRFRDGTATASGNDSDPVSHFSSNYGSYKGNIKRVGQKLVFDNENLDFSGDGEGSVSERVGSEITDDVAIGSEGLETDSLSGFERKKRIGKKIEDLVDEDEDEDEDSVNDGVECERKDDVVGGSDDPDLNTFVGFDSAASKERRKRFVEKLEELADENDGSEGFGLRLDTEVKDDSFDLPSGENSSNSVTNSVDTKIRDSTSNGSLGFDYTASDKRKKRFAKRLEVLKMRKENSDFNTENSLNEENRSIAATNIGNDDELVNNESSSGFLFVLAGLVIKALGLQLSLFFSLVLFPLKFIYSVYMFVVDPFQIARRGKDYVRSRLFKIVGFVCQKFLSSAGEWLKEHESVWQLVLRFGWGFLWAAYVSIVLFSLLISAFIFSGVLIKKLVDEPIQMKEALVFDYTKNNPVALVPITSCPSDPRHVSFAEKGDVGKTRFSRVIPYNHKLQATVSLTLPESDYNRNLGMFQVRVDLLSANGGILTSSRRSCMLHFISQPIRMLLIFFKIAPLITGYSSESQTLNINLRGLIEKDIPTSCLRVIIEQRAEFRPGAGIPEIYEAFLTLESELPLLKKLMWQWKRTLFIWLGLSMFMMELLLTLICCRSLLLPRRGVGHRSAGPIASPDNHPAQR